ncbi:MAG TPA: hypothetical protein VH419_04925 [Nocardioidaceae bacterium]|jgi:hypothetical protein
MYQLNNSIRPRYSRQLLTVAAGLGILAAAAGAGTSPSEAAVADYTVWTSVPSACSPDEASTGRYDAHVSAFKHANGATGQLVTRCNVVNLPEFGLGDSQRLQAVYRDTDGVGTGQQVLVDLIQARPDGSTVILARLNSNSFSGSQASQTRSVGYTHNFDFEHNAYYVEVRVTRSSTSTTPAASTVRLTSFAS